MCDQGIFIRGLKGVWPSEGTSEDALLNLLHVQWDLHYLLIFRVSQNTLVCSPKQANMTLRLEFWDQLSEWPFLKELLVWHPHFPQRTLERGPCSVSQSGVSFVRCRKRRARLPAATLQCGVALTNSDLTLQPKGLLPHRQAAEGWGQVAEKVACAQIDSSNAS